MANISRPRDWRVPPATQSDADGSNLPPQNSTRFQYQPLNHEDEIRLLKIQADRGNVIRCSMHHFQLDSRERPNYRALSYTWDRDDPTYDIWMPDDSVLKARKNLRDALHSLRDPESPCWLWCDALCINQDSTEERNHQVKLMAKIYSNARVVAVWLESAGQTADFETAFEYIQRGAPGTAGAVPGLRALEKVCNLRYWNRKWVSGEVYKTSFSLSFGTQQCVATWYTNKPQIIQEILLAPVVVLHAVKSQCALEKLRDFLNRSDIGQTELRSTPAARLASQRLDGAERDQQLYKLVERYSQNECQLPCDHIYALYSLVGEHREQFAIDYGSSPEERFRVVLDFAQNYEHLPPQEVPDFARLLLRLFELDLTELCRMDNVLDSLRLTVSVAVLDTLVLQEAGVSLQLQELVTPLEPVHAFSLTLDQAHWTVRRHRDEIRDVSGRRDMDYFGVPGTSFIGLAGCRLEAQDKIWNLPGTNLMFVVRHLTANAARIVGRAYLFSSESTPQNASLCKEWLSRPLDLTTAAPRDLDVSVNCTDLLSLILQATAKSPPPATQPSAPLQGLGNLISQASYTTDDASAHVASSPRRPSPAYPSYPTRAPAESAPQYRYHRPPNPVRPPAYTAQPRSSSDDTCECGQSDECVRIICCPAAVFCSLWQAYPMRTSRK